MAASSRLPPIITTCSSDPPNPGNFANPYATTEGEWWINQGGTISLMDQDINVQLLVDAPAVGWTTDGRFSGERYTPGRHRDHQHVALEQRLRFVHGRFHRVRRHDIFHPRRPLRHQRHGLRCTRRAGLERSNFSSGVDGLYPTYAAAEASHTPGVYAAASGLFSETPSYATDPNLGLTSNNRPPSSCSRCPFLSRRPCCWRPAA